MSYTFILLLARQLLDNISYMEETPEIKITKRRQELYLKLTDSVALIRDIEPRVIFLENHFPNEKLDRALSWLIANNVVGRVFMSWFINECKKSDLEMHRLLLSIVDNAALTNIVAGKNFKL